MKVIILSDIHGNADALRAVLQEVPENIAEFWILGDMIGYYYQSKEVLELLKNLPSKYISGNHELYLREGLKNTEILTEYKAKYGSSLEIAIKTLSSEDINFLTSLPDLLEFDINSLNILLCHGSPSSNNEYVYPDVAQKKLKEYNELKADFIFQGHTHYPMDLIQNNKRIINPGSVGQPRNRNPGAHWAIFDLGTNDVTFKTTLYSIDSLLSEIDRFDPQNSYLKTVLTRI